MDGINRKKMKDVVVPPHAKARPPSRENPEPSRPQKPLDDWATPEVRIQENPFFAKERAVTKPLIVERKKKHSRLWLWSFVAMSFVGAGVAILSHFSSATIEIVPQSETFSVAQEFTALKDAPAGELAFHFMSLTEEKSKEVSATIEKTLQKKASGKVIIYNAYSAQSQKLIKNTRLESPDHKIFRIDESVTVPGAKVSGGKIITPGAVEATVYADAPGKEYNIGLADFTIPGFKSDPRYSKFTARGKPDSPIGGGFSGTVKIPSDQDVQNAQSTLRDEIKTLAVEKARVQIPPRVTFFPGSVIIKFEDVPQDFSGNSTAVVSVRATVSIFFFDTALLTKKITTAGLKDYKGEAGDILNIQTLSFAFLDPVDNVVLSDIDHLRFALKGDATFVWKIDTTKLALDASSKDKKDLSKIIETQGSVKKAEAVVRPMWNTTFPSDPANISVKIINQ